MISLPLFQLLALLFGGWQDHCQIRSIHLKEDAVLCPDVVSDGRGVDQLVVLIVGKSLFYHDVQHGTRVGDSHLGLLLVTGLHHKVLREGIGEDTPDTISVQLKRPPVSQRRRFIAAFL